MREQRRKNDAGYTLVELLVGVVLLALITGATSAAFVTAIHASGPTHQRTRESNDAQVIAAYLVRDAQAAGGVNVNFGTADTSLGVMNHDETAAATDFGCTDTAAGAQFKLGFKWNDRSVDASGNQTSTPHVANYFFISSTHRIERTTCVGGGAATSFELASSIASVTAGCTPTCTNTPALPDLVSLAITETNNPVNSSPNPYTYTLTASLRPESESAPNSSTAALTPLLALGGSCADGVSGIDAQGGGSSTVTVYGAAEVNGGCPAVNFQGSINFGATAGISVLSPGTCSGVTQGCSTYTTPVADPFAALPPPPVDCTNGTHPAPTGTTFYPGTYKSAVSLVDATFMPGIYVFCAGLSTSGNVTANNVLFYFAGGSLVVSQGSFSASAQSSGIYGSGADGADIVVWEAKTDSTELQVCCSNTTVAHFTGTMYAPNALVTLHNGTITVTQVVAKAVSWEGGGNGSTTIGTAPASPLALATPTTLKAWTVNVPYPSATASATGGSGGYVFTATGLPAGISIDPLTGVISGTPTVTVTASVTVTVTDTIGEKASRTYTLQINPAPSISAPNTLTNWTVNRAYIDTAIVVSGGTAPFTWSTTANLPPGLAIDPSTGVVGGTPTSIGTSTATVKVVDAAGVSATRNYTITINAPPSITGPPSVPTNVSATVAYPSTTITGTGGTTPYTWSASGLPPGLTIGAGSGVISGTPTTAGTYGVTVTLKDKAGASATASYSILVNPAPGITTTALPVGEQSRPYSFQMTSDGKGTPPFTWSVTGGTSLPPGITLSTSGLLSGTPTQSGTWNVKIKITDSPGASSTSTFNFVIATPPAVNGPASLANWTVGVNYPQTQVTATGGVTPFTFTASGLPLGMSINTAGLITGTPSVSGPVTVVVTVNDALGGSATRSYSFVINAQPTISTASLPDGEQGRPYSTPLSATNGTPGYVWAASGLPAGLSMNSATGVISGTPTVAGAFPVTVTATDSAGASDSRTLTINVSTPPAIGAATMPNWTVGVAYPNTTIPSTGGHSPFTWSAANLPAGLAIDPNTGTISGTPTTAESDVVSVTITDSLGGSSTQTYSVTINPAPSITTVALPSWTMNQPYDSVTMSSAGGTQPVTWAATGLPTGLQNDMNTGIVSGTPTTLGPFTATITVLDSIGASASRTYSIGINDIPAVATTSLPDAQQNVSYTAMLAGSNGTTPYSWSATGVPDGLSIAADGTVSGAPTTAGTFNVDVTLTDAAGVTSTSTVSITVSP